MGDQTTNFSDQNEEYVNTPQNDLRQIEQIAREYESEPAKGIAHGLQKDAIQNGVGARFPGNEPNSYKNWCFKFKLFKIKGKYALSFEDQGTKGLTGNILTVEEIDEWSSKGKLTPEQNLSRFLTRFDSGGSYGPGSFGRGKLIFQATSKVSAIVCDSLRYDDGKYVAFERKLIGNRLVQTKILYQDERAKQFIHQISDGTLSPLKVPGTRITIVYLKEEIIDAIKNSFKEDEPEIMNDYSLSFIKMIQESWWEILQKFEVKIFVEFNGQIKQVKLPKSLKSITKAKDGEGGWRIYKQNNILVVIQDTTYKIKELKFALSPNILDSDDIRGFWIQRKRMKIGNIKGIMPHHTIAKKICGYVILDPDLENEIEKSEGTTHYSFNFRQRAPNQIRQIVNAHLNRFQEQLGIRTTSETRKAQQDMLDAMKEINEAARELGLLSEFYVGPQSKDIEITIESFGLPNKNSKRVDFENMIGPIIYKIKNNTRKLQQTELFVTVEQRGMGEHKKSVFKKGFDLKSKESKSLECSSFKLNDKDFRNGEAVIIFARINNKNSGEKMCQVSRMLWLGREEPKTEESHFIVTAYKPLFPRARSTRVEMTESIRNLRFRVSNKSACDVGVNVNLIARKSPSTGDPRLLKEMKNDRDLMLPAMSDKEFVEESLDISGDNFASINAGPANAEERKCEIYFNVRLSQHVPNLNMKKAQNIGKKKIDFYVGIDPPGRSIFNKVLQANNPKEGKRSWHEGDRASGYSFILNVGHPSYKFADSYGDEVRQEYIREQMLRQAYAIAVVEQEFTGVAEEYEESLTNPEISSAEAFLKFEEMIGKAIIELN